VRNAAVPAFVGLRAASIPAVPAVAGLLAHHASSSVRLTAAEALRQLASCQGRDDWPAAVLDSLQFAAVNDQDLAVRETTAAILAM